MKDINQKIVKKAKNGDLEAIDYIIKFYSNLAHFIASKTISDKSLVEDCANEMLGRLANKIHQYDLKNTKFRTWVYIVFNTACFNFKEKLDNYNEFISLDDDLVFKCKDEPVNDNLIYKLSKIEKLVGKENYEILLLKLGYGYKFCEIAKLKNIHESKVKRDFYKAYEQAKEYVENENEEEF